MRFDTCLPLILAYEGGYVNNPADRGGATNKGITQSVFDAWNRAQGNGYKSVKDITDDEVKAIYKAQYWTRSGADRCPEPIDLVLFDCSVNSGVSRAVKWLQKALNINADGSFGPKTQEAANACNPVETALEMLIIREDFLDDLIDRDPSQAVFRLGWHARLDKLKTEITRGTT